MKERLISMIRPMVLATRAGTKTITRRVIKAKYPIDTHSLAVITQRADGNWHLERWPKQEREMNNFGRCETLQCPHGKPGDVLGIREAAWMWCQKVRNGKTPKGRPKWKYVPVYHPAVPVEPRFIVYCADSPGKPTKKPAVAAFQDLCWRYKPARFLPRWAIRTRVQITSIRVERVQNISAADALAEGAEQWLKDADAEFGNIEEPILIFRSLWDSINFERGHGWGKNDWVWIVVFKLLP